MAIAASQRYKQCLFYVVNLQRCCLLDFVNAQLQRSMFTYRCVCVCVFVCDVGISDREKRYLNGASVAKEVACKVPCKHPSLEPIIMQNAQCPGLDLCIALPVARPFHRVTLAFLHDIKAFSG